MFFILIFELELKFIACLFFVVMGAIFVLLRAFVDVQVTATLNRIKIVL